MFVKGGEMKELIFVLVKWGDASENSSDDEDRIIEAVPVLTTYTCGYLIYEDEHMITLARDYFPAITRQHNDTVRRKLTIPKGMIKMLLKFKVTVDLD
jgi:hypothetical protein